MKTSFILFLGLFYWHTSLYSQSVFNLPSDTIKFNLRTGGAIDTFDLSYSFPINSAPLGGYNTAFNSSTVSFLKSSPNLFSATEAPLLKNWKVSALPHLGFHYSVGTKGIQFLHMDYQQVFMNGLLLNLDLHRKSNARPGTTAGLMQNSSFTNQDASLGLNYDKKRWNAQFNGGYRYVDANLSGGISDEFVPVINSLNLEFATVNKAQANSQQRFVDLNGQLRYRLSKDSSSNNFGVQTIHQYSVWNKVYNEVSDSINLLYTTVNIDTTTTRDQFQDAKLLNGFGFYYTSNSFKIDVALTHRYWRFQNLGINRDTNEVGAEANLRYKLGKMILSNHSKINLIGAEQESQIVNSIAFGTKSKGFRININQYNILPGLIQRNYFANNIDYTNPLVKQNRSEFSINGNYSLRKIEGDIRMGIVNWKNKLVWDSDNWVINSNSAQTIQQIDLKLHWDLGVFQIYPRALIQLGSEFVPLTTFTSRFLFKKRVFKAKKLELLWAIDPSVKSEYSLLEYNTLLDNYYFPETSKTGGQTFTLHSTFTLGIDEFRFFLRAENIQHFWTENAIEEVRNYYRAPFLFRVGFSWDFFN